MFTKKLLSMICVCWVGFGLGMIDNKLETKPIGTITVSVSTIDGTTKKIELPIPTKYNIVPLKNNANFSDFINEYHRLGHFGDFINECYASFNIDQNDFEIKILLGNQDVTEENYHELTDGAELTLIIQEDKGKTKPTLILGLVLS